MQVRVLLPLLHKTVLIMEITIAIKTPSSRILPFDDEMTIDISIKDMRASDAHLFADMRPLIADTILSHCKAAKIPNQEKFAEAINRMLYDEDVQ